MSSEKNAYAEMPVTQKVYKLETPQLLHQPMIVAVDVSTSMDFKSFSSTMSAHLPGVTEPIS